ncbi:gp27 [Mycobacterium phage Brujita]|uniref:Minor tail protein n=4 Tax=Caudoviricetes TaxID=2731619 RepID=A0A143FPN8_9CAUD|nr:gp27 [Mycobacterium phage Brujita]YP_009303784.1 hypothetical protein SEA_SHIPWRECK_26 [Mycobacterium phage Shipwreck]ADL71211.1 hypothetical protein ISLAND3_27 [Mycobacterium phage Island3]ASD53656.1 hypothetical protein SEA_BOGIE_26 [Mycobacterium phage Bogie]ACI06241.1 hypothetical protein BRUJITA_27 [Mycobacterium phage Brujita]AMW63845.1 hypothetical protein SEA_SHIPWRECK_26 [Mycobacterium phage Shipwreck]
MALQGGSNPVKGVYRGGDLVKGVYLGDTPMWLPVGVEFAIAGNIAVGGTGGNPSVVVPEDANCVVVWVAVQGGDNAITATFDGHTMDRHIMLAVSGWRLAAFTLFDPPTGNKSATFSGISGIATYCTSVAIAYKNVGSIGTPVTNSGTGTSMSISATGVARGYVSNAFMLGSVTGYDETNGQTLLRSINAAAFVNQGMAVGHAPGDDTVTFSATQSASAAWLAGALPLLPP